MMTGEPALQIEGEVCSAGFASSTPQVLPDLGRGVECGARTRLATHPPP